MEKKIKYTLAIVPVIVLFGISVWILQELVALLIKSLMEALEVKDLVILIAIITTGSIFYLIIGSTTGEVEYVRGNLYRCRRGFRRYEILTYRVPSRLTKFDPTFLAIHFDKVYVMKKGWNVYLIFFKRGKIERKLIPRIFIPVKIPLSYFYQRLYERSLVTLRNEVLDDDMDYLLSLRYEKGMFTAKLFVMMRSERLKSTLNIVKLEPKIRAPSDIVSINDIKATISELFSLIKDDSYLTSEGLTIGYIGDSEFKIPTKSHRFIVGLTGSGKTSLALTLFRKLKGTVIYINVSGQETPLIGEVLVPHVDLRINAIKEVVPDRFIEIIDNTIKALEIEVRGLRERSLAYKVLRDTMYKYSPRDIDELIKRLREEVKSVQAPDVISSINYVIRYLERIANAALMSTSKDIIDLIKGRKVVIDMRYFKTDEARSFYTLLLLTFLFEKWRAVYEDLHIIIDEARRIIPHASSETSIISRMLSEARKKSIWITLIDQTFSIRRDSSCIGNVSQFLIFKVIDVSDVDYIAKLMEPANFMRQRLLKDIIRSLDKFEVLFFDTKNYYKLKSLPTFTKTVSVQDICDEYSIDSKTLIELVNRFSREQIIDMIANNDFRELEKHGIDIARVRGVLTSFYRIPYHYLGLHDITVLARIHGCNERNLRELFSEVMRDRSILIRNNPRLYREKRVTRVGLALLDLLGLLEYPKPNIEGLSPKAKAAYEKLMKYALDNYGSRNVRYIMREFIKHEGEFDEYVVSELRELFNDLRKEAQISMRIFDFVAEDSL